MKYSTSQNSKKHQRQDGSHLSVVIMVRNVGSSSIVCVKALIVSYELAVRYLLFANYVSWHWKNPPFSFSFTLMQYLQVHILS
jgi:hypothetical protein